MMTRKELDAMLAALMPDSIEARVRRANFIPGSIGSVTFYIRGKMQCAELHYSLKRVEAWRWTAKLMHRTCVKQFVMEMYSLN